MDWTTIILILAAVIVISFLIFNYVYKPWSVSMTLLNQGPVLLNNTTTFDKFIPALLNTDNYTFAFYIFPIGGDKTIKRSDNPFKNPPVFGWDSVFLFTQESNGRTYLSVNTINNNATDYSKYIKIPCPPLPSQKWTYVGIVIEGRRFSVLYNGRIVASQIIGNMPRINKSGTLFSGNKIDDNQGQLAYVSYNDRAMGSDELMIEYASTSNTRGEPYLSASILDMFGCPAGVFCYAPTGPPKQAKLAWSTPFA